LDAANMPSIAIVTGTYPPRHRDGTGLSFLALARRLAARGWAVNVLVTKGKPVDGTGTGPAVPGETSLAAGLSNFEDVMSEIARRPVDVVVTSKNAGFAARLATALAPRPVVIYLQGVTRPRFESALPASAHVAFASEFLRSLYAPSAGRDGPVLRPIVEAAVFRAVSSRRRHVLAVGLARVKRPDIVYAVARRLPHIRFDLYNSWGELLRWRNWPVLVLPNLRFHNAVDNAAQLFGDARAVMVASDSEGWCRVVTEAQLIGIPTVARQRAALPESVGSGGVLLPAEADIAQWVAALRAVFDDEAQYDALVAAARVAALRPELDPDRIFADWLDLLARAIKG
jgi:glycosyltransferase involved in cell wall biosynthesis